MATLSFHNAKNQLSSKQSFKKTYFSKDASTLDVSGFLLIDTIHGVWSYLPPRGVNGWTIEAKYIFQLLSFLDPSSYQ